MSTIIPLSGLYKDDVCETERLISETLKNIHGSVTSISAIFSVEGWPFPRTNQGDCWRWYKRNILGASCNGGLLFWILLNRRVTKEETEIKTILIAPSERPTVKNTNLKHRNKAIANTIFIFFSKIRAIEEYCLICYQFNLTMYNCKYFQLVHASYNKRDKGWVKRVCECFNSLWIWIMITVNKHKLFSLSFINAMNYYLF